MNKRAVLSHMPVDLLQIDRTEFDRIQAMTERQFDCDALPKPSELMDGCAVQIQSHVSGCVLPALPFTSVNVSGKHVWVHTPADDLVQVILHYMRCKALNPDNTSACFLVPSRGKGTSWRPLLRRLMRRHASAQGV